MAILGKTSITELNLITPLSNANLENSKITINGTDVPLGGSYASNFDWNAHIGTNLATYISKNLTETGTIKISLPFKNTSNMVTFEILIYEYDGDRIGGSKIIASAYNWNLGTSWHYGSATVTGRYDRDIRFAYDGDKSCILLGGVTDTWSYPQIFVSKLYNGFGADSNVFKEGYSISFITSESGLSGSTTCSKYLCASKSDIPGAFTGATASAAGKMGLVPAPSAGDVNKYLTGGGQWAQPILYTAGALQNNNKLFLIGTVAQSSSVDQGMITFSNANVYMQAGKLYANGSEVGTMETINNTVSALTASNVNLNTRISALESRSSLSIAVSTDKTYLLGAASTSATTVNIQTGSTSSENGVWMSNGTITATKGFYQVSDEREKNFKNEIDIDFDKLKSIPKSYFTWKGAEDEKLEIGTSAQKLKEVYPELVSYDIEDDKYTVSYDKLSVVALKAVDKLHEENEILKEMLIKMEERVSKLENNK